MRTQSTTKTAWRFRLAPILATLLILLGQLIAALPAAHQTTVTAAAGSVTMTIQNHTGNQYNVGDPVTVLNVDSDAAAGSSLTYDLNAARLTYDPVATLAAVKTYHSTVTSLDNADFTISAANGILTTTNHTAGALQVFPLVFKVASDLGGGTTLTAMSGAAVGGSITLTATAATFDPTQYGITTISASADIDNGSAIYKLGNAPLFYTTQLDTSGATRWSLSARSNPTGGTLAEIFDWLENPTGTLPQRATTASTYDSPFTAFGTNRTEVGTLSAAMTFDHKFRSDRTYQLVAYKPVSEDEPASFPRIGDGVLSRYYYLPSTTTLPALTFSATGTLGMVPPVEGDGIYGQYYLNGANQLAIRDYKVKRLRVMDVSSGTPTGITGAIATFTDMVVNTTNATDGGEFLPEGYTGDGDAFYWGKGSDNAGTQVFKSLTFTNSANYYILGGTGFSLATSPTDVFTASGNSTGVSVATRTVASSSNRRLSTVDIQVQDRTKLTTPKRYMQVKAVDNTTQAALPGVNFNIQEVQNTAGDAITAGSMTTTNATGETVWNQIPEAMLGTQTRIVALTQTNTLDGYLPATGTYYAKWQLGTGFTAVGTDPANLTATSSGLLSVNAGELIVASAQQPVYTLSTQYPEVSSSTSPTTPPENVIYQNPMGIGAVDVTLSMAGATGTFTGTTDASGNLQVTPEALADALGVPQSTFATAQPLTLTVDSLAAGYTNPVARTVNFSSSGGFSILAGTTADNATILDHTTNHGLTIAAGNLIALLRHDELVVQGPSVDGGDPKPVANGQFSLQFYTLSGSTYTAIGSPTTVTSDANGSVLLPDIATLSHAAIQPKNTYYAQLTQTGSADGFADLPMQAMFKYDTQMGYSLTQVTQNGTTTTANFIPPVLIDQDFWIGYQDTASASTAFNVRSLSLPFRRTQITLSLLEATISLDSVPANLNFGRTQAKSINQSLPLLGPSAPSDQLASWGGVAAPATDVMTIGGTAEDAIGVQVTLDTAASSWKLMLDSQLLTTDGATLNLANRNTYLGTASAKGTLQSALSDSATVTIPLTSDTSQAATQILAANMAAVGTYRLLWATGDVSLALPQNRGAVDGAEYKTQMTWQLEATP